MKTLILIMSLLIASNSFAAWNMDKEQLNKDTTSLIQNIESQHPEYVKHTFNDGTVMFTNDRQATKIVPCNKGL